LPLVIDTVTGGAPRVANVEIVLLGKSVAWEKMIHEKKTEAKNLMILSFLMEVG
jgi:hypothetical protein